MRREAARRLLWLLRRLDRDGALGPRETIRCRQVLHNLRAALGDRVQGRSPRTGEVSVDVQRGMPGRRPPEQERVDARDVLGVWSSP
jgi:hypothetical protein